MELHPLEEQPDILWLTGKLIYGQVDAVVAPALFISGVKMVSNWTISELSSPQFILLKGSYEFYEFVHLATKE